jgi:hypothetical protein
VDRELQRLIDQLKQAGVDTAAFEAQFNNTNRTIAESQRLLQTMRTTLRGLQDGFQDVRDILKESLAELTKTESAIKRGTKAYRSLTSVVSSLAQEEEGIYDYSVKQLDAFDKKNKAAYSELKRAARTLANEKGLAGLRGAALENAINQEKAAGNLNDAEEAILRAKADGYRTERRSLRLAEARLKRERAVVETFGLTGAALESATKIANKFGMSHISEDLSNINTKLKKEMRAEIKRNGDQALGFGKKFQFAGKAIGQTAKAIGKGMMDPLFIIGKISKSFLDLNKAAVDLSRLVGRTNVSFNNLNSSLATTSELLKTAAEFTRETGLAATSIFSNNQLANIAESTKLLGLSASQANNLAIFSQTTGQSISSFESGLTDGIAAANKFGKAAVAPGVALQDALSASRGVALSLGNNPKLLGQAATAARALGLELARVDNIAEGLLDFESSIQNELEAQLLTGGQINLAKARELALNNDLAGLSAELAKNGASAAEFANMNRIQQNSLAKALGMSRDELAKTIIQQDIQGNLTDEQRVKILGITAEQLKQQDIQASINDSITKMSEALAGPLAALAQLVSYAGVMKGLFTAIAVITTTQLVTSLKASLLTLGKMVFPLAKLVGLSSAKAIADLTSAQALTLGLGTIGIIAGIAAVSSFMNKEKAKAKQVGDLAISPNGGPIVMSPREGELFQGTKNDALMMAPPTAMRGNNAELIAEIRALRSVVEKGGGVYMDSTKVGEALMLGVYKS